MFAGCLSGGTRRVSNRTQRDCGADKSTSQFIKMLTWESQLRVEGSRVHKDRTKPSEGGEGARHWRTGARAPLFCAGVFEGARAPDLR